MTWEKPAFVILHVTLLQAFKSQICIVAETAGAFQELCPEPLSKQNAWSYANHASLKLECYP